MDLVRKILLELEKHEHGFAPRSFAVEGYSEEELGFHVYMMREGRLLRGTDVTHLGSSSPCAVPVRITWDGYEFLEAARQPKLWEAAKKRILATGAGLTLDVLKTLLIRMAKDELGLE
jgi:hypothetical protein